MIKFRNLTIYIEEKAHDDWRAGCIVEGYNSDFEYRAYGTDQISAIRSLANYLEKGLWDCEYPK